MQDFIRRQNIELFRTQLATGQLDDAQRTYLEKMLAEELSKADESVASILPRDTDELNRLS